MSRKIPFLEMFAALRQWLELSNGVEGWLIVSAAIDKKSRSASILVEGAGGAGPNLIAQAEAAVCRCYGLNSVKIRPAPEEKKTPSAPAPNQERPAPAPVKAAPAPHEEKEEDPFARAEAIRRAAMRGVSAPAAKKEKKPSGKAIYG